MASAEHNKMREEVTRVFASTPMDDPLWDRVSAAFSWEGVWPEVDADLRLTGAVIEPHDWEYYPVHPSHDAVIHRRVAAAAGWKIDADRGCAYPPAAKE